MSFAPQTSSRNRRFRQGPQTPLIPAQAGIQLFSSASPWVPAFAGTSGLPQLHQQTREQLRALRQAVDDDVFLQGMRARAADTKSIERRDAECAGKIRIRAAAGALMLEVNAEPLGKRPRLLVHRHRFVVRLPHRPNDKTMAMYERSEEKTSELQ